MPRRPNIPALLLAAAIVFGGGALVLRDVPAIRSMGAIFLHGDHESGITREPPPPTACPGSASAGSAYVFTGDCAGQVASADGSFLVVKNGGVGTGVGLVRAADAASLDDLDALDDGNGFAVLWAPHGESFFANHEVSGVERAGVYAIDDGRLAHRAKLPEAARALAIARAGCPANAAIAVSGRQWQRDGVRLVLSARPGKGGCAQSGTIWVIGDPVTGTIDPASIRTSDDDAMPKDGPYAAP